MTRPAFSALAPKRWIACSWMAGGRRLSSWPGRAASREIQHPNLHIGGHFHFHGVSEQPLIFALLADHAQNVQRIVPGHEELMSGRQKAPRGWRGLSLRTCAVVRFE